MENKKLCPYTVEVEDGEPVFTGGGVTFGAFCDTFAWDVLETYIGGDDADMGFDEADIPAAAIVTAFYVRGDIAQVEFDENPVPVKPIFIDTSADGYDPDQCGKTLTIRELIDALEYLLESYDEDTPVFFRNDNGYTYGSICETSIVEPD